MNLSDTYVKCVLYTGLYACDYVIMCVYASMNIFGIWHDPERRLRRFKDLFLFWLCLCGVGLSLSLSQVNAAIQMALWLVG